MYRETDHQFDKPMPDFMAFKPLHGCWTWDLETGLISLDERCRGMLGLPREAGIMAREAWLRRLRARDLLRILPRVEAAIRHGEPYHVEYRILNAAEQWIWLETRGRVVEWRDGRPIRVAGIHADISARVEAERALAINQTRQKTLIAALPDLIFVLDADGVISEYYPPAQSPLDYPAHGEWIGQSYFKVFPLDVAYFITDCILRLLDEPTPMSADMTLEIVGELREFRLILSKLTDGENGTLGFLCVALDIGERQRGRQAPIPEHERLALALEGSGDAAWTWDLARGEYWYSPRWWHMLGYEVEGVSRDPEHGWRFIHEADVASARYAVEQALADAGNDRLALEYRVRHRAGHTLRILARGHIQRDGDGQPLRVAGTNMDVTPPRGHEKRG